RLRADHEERVGGVAVHRSSDPGHWIVTYPWTGAERARTIAEAALALAERDVSPARRARLTGSQERLVGRWVARIAEARATPPSWIRDADRRIPIVSITGTNGKSTVTRLITHILKIAGKRVGTTTLWRRSAGGCAPTSPCSRSARAEARRRRSDGRSPRAAAATSCATAGSSRSTAAMAAPRCETPRTVTVPATPGQAR